MINNKDAAMESFLNCGCEDKVYNKNCPKNVPELKRIEAGLGRMKTGENEADCSCMVSSVGCCSSAEEEVETLSTIYSI